MRVGRFGNPLHLSASERLLLTSVAMFSAGGFSGLIWLSHQTDLWEEVLGEEAVMATVPHQFAPVSGVMSVVFLWAGCITLSLAVAAHILTEHTEQPSRR